VLEPGVRERQDWNTPLGALVDVGWLYFGSLNNIIGLTEMMRSADWAAFEILSVLRLIAWVALGVLTFVAAAKTRGFRQSTPRGPVLAAGWLAVAIVVLTVLQRTALAKIVGFEGSALLLDAFKSAFWPVSFAADTGQVAYAAGLLILATLFLVIITSGYWTLKVKAAATPQLTVDPTTGGAAMTIGPNGEIAAGWYPDPDGKPADRYWDGQSWTEQTRPASAPRPAPVAVGALSVPGYNVLAIIAFVAAFVVPLILPIVLGYIARGQIRRTGEQGAGLALAAIILGWIFTGFFVLFVALGVLAAS